MKPGCWVCLLVLLSAPAYGQAVVEHSVIITGSSLGAAGAKGVGKSIGSVFSELDKVMDRAGKPSEGTASRSSQLLTPASDLQSQSEVRQASSGDEETAAQGSEVQLRPVPEDYTEIAVGITRSDLLRRFGDASMKTTALHGSRVVETMWYSPENQQKVVVTVEDGKVTRVSQSPRADGQTAGVIVLQ